MDWRKSERIFNLIIFRLQSMSEQKQKAPFRSWGAASHLMVRQKFTYAEIRFANCPWALRRKPSIKFYQNEENNFFDCHNFLFMRQERCFASCTTASCAE